MDTNPNEILFPETGMGLGWDNPYRKTYSVYLLPPSDFKPKFQAVGCFCDYQGQILLLKRNSDVVEGNTWGIPGGKIDKDELPRAAAVRETFEETGLNVDSVTDLKEMRKHYIRLAHFDFVFHMYRIRAAEPYKIRLAPKEHQEYQWLTVPQILELALITGEIESFLYYAEERVSRHQTYPSCSILRELNPSKGLIVWREPERETVISWPSYHDFRILKKLSTRIEGNLEITISPFTWIGDFLPLLHGMHQYNFNKIDPSYNQDKNFKIASYNVCGQVFGESAIVENISLKNEGAVIPSLEKEIFQKGARRIYIPLINARRGMAPLFPTNHDNVETSRRLQKRGYVEIPGSCNLMTNEYVGTLMKELTFEAPSDCGYKNIPCEDSNSPLKIDWNQEDNPLNFPPLLEQFGVFVRDESGQTKGCVFGKIEALAAHPHAFINLFFMDESIRGTGLGKKVMEHAETYIKNRGINLIELGTSDHQAPWFYEKIGYTRESTLPKFFKGRDGQYINAYNYYKNLG